MFALTLRSVRERDELQKRVGITACIAVVGLALQLVAWGDCWYWLYDPVPTFKVIASDYPDVGQSDAFHCMVKLSDAIVIATGSDEMYTAGSLAFVLLCALCHLCVMASLKRGLLLGIWTAFSTAVPLALLGYFLSASRAFVHDLMVSHPELADWPIPWIGVFR